MTTRESAPSAALTEMASSPPPTNSTTATARAAAVETRPAGIGLPGFRPASNGASTRSLTVPIPSWRSVIASPIRSATSGAPPATRAIAPLTRPSRIEGNGCPRRSHPTTRWPVRGRGGDGPSDVDELVEVRDEVLDQALAAVLHLRPDPRHEHIERDRRHHQAAIPVPPDDRRRTATGSEHPFETRLIEPGRPPEVADDLADAAAD